MEEGAFVDVARNDIAERLGFAVNETQDKTSNDGASSASSWNWV